MSRRDHDIGASKSPDLALGQTATLADVLALPLDPRSTAINESGKVESAETLRRLRDEGASLPAHFDTERLAFGVAWSAGAETGGAGYRGTWATTTLWSAIWRTFTSPREGKRPRAVTLLGELALSIGCERRDDWQPRTAKPIVADEADRAFEYVHGQNYDLVLTSLRDRARHEDPVTMATEGWARVYHDYWSVEARSRFGGLSTLATFVGRVARFAAIDEYRARKRMRQDVTGRDDEPQRLEACTRGLGRERRYQFASVVSRVPHPHP